MFSLSTKQVHEGDQVKSRLQKVKLAIGMGNAGGKRSACACAA